MKFNPKNSPKALLIALLFFTKNITFTSPLLFIILTHIENFLGLCDLDYQVFWKESYFIH